MIPTRFSVVLPALAATALLVASCGDDDADGSPGATGGSEGDVTVVAITSVWADVVDAVTCRGDAGIGVVGLIPPKSDPHSYEASLQDRETIDAAAAVVANGRELETGFVDLLGSVDENRLIEVSELPDLEIPETAEVHGEHEGEEHEGEEHIDDTAAEHTEEAHTEDEEGHDHASGDPHIWLDPQLMADAVAPLAERLIASTGVDAGPIDTCAEEYAAELRALDTEISELTATLPDDRRVLVTNHDAYGFFAARYGFEIAGTVIPSTSTMAETNPADLADLAETIEQEGVPAIFVDTSHSAADAEALADRIGVDVIPLDTEAIGSSGSADTYVSMMRSNATAIVDALKS